MRLINVCHLSALSAVLAFFIVISSATPRTPLLIRKSDGLEVKREPVSLSSDGTLGPRPLAKRVDINDLVSKELGQGWTMHVVKYYALVPVDSAAQALESFYSNIRRQASAVTQQSAAASLPARVNGIAGNLFTADSAFFQLKISCATTSIPWSFVTNWALRMKDSSTGGYTGLYYMWFVHTTGTVIWVTLTCSGIPTPGII